jgi:ATP-dependent helicase/nuclease subunit A
MNKVSNVPQLKASDPNVSVWTMASAGTGKTKVLIDRLMRLFVTGADPQKILCLTFTKAAANEIQVRIKQEMEKWSKSNDEELKTILANLFDVRPKDSLLVKARNLLQEISKAPEPIKICTIHAFCQYILKKFPVEAGISPTFRVIDEMFLHQAIENLKKDLFSSKQALDAVRFFAQNFHETTIDEILYSVISGKFLSLIDQFEGSKEYKHYLSQTTKIPIRQQDQIIASYVLNIPIKEQIKAEVSNYKDSEIIKRLNSYLCLNEKEKVRKWKNLIPIFLTTEQSKRVSILSKTTKDHNPTLITLLEKWQEDFANLVENIANHFALLSSTYLYEVAQVLLQMYQNFKIKNEYLDYNDLIFFTNKLLGQSSDKEWVLYKLDGGIDHILVDEAQDTSADQWQVIQNLIFDFFSGDSRKSDRTIFVVGDKKQSIYSFQGADVLALQNTRQILAAGMCQANKRYLTIDLTYCYRSTQVIVDFIQKAVKASKADFVVPDITSVRSTNLGRVELWPVLNETIKQDIMPWPSPTENHHQESTKFKMAKIIACYIKDLLEKGTVLPSTGLRIRESDITILVQRRNDFTNLLIDALRKQGLLVSGLDRVKLQSNLSVLDIIAIAKFVLLPSDNLNCAIVLKSPLFNLQEDELYALAKNKEIWQAICSSTLSTYRAIHSKLCAIIDLSIRYSVFDFFFILIDHLGLRGLLMQHNSDSDDQVIDEFLQIAKRFETGIGGNLYAFLNWFAANDVEIKRDHLAKGGIKIMTVHAAKGLESSVVIIPDATSLKIQEHRICWIENNAVLFLPREKSTIITKYKTIEHQKAYQEYLRLMYVAFTRCKDYLILCANNPCIGEESWYSIAKRTMHKYAINKRSELLEQLGLQGDLWVMQSQEFALCNKLEKIVTAKEKEMPMRPQWKQPPLSQSEVFSKSPLEENNIKAQYGSIVHKLLEESLNGNKDLANHIIIQKMDANQQAEVLFKIKRLFACDFWQSLLKDKIYTELPFVDYANGKNFIGRIDLLTISESEIRIVDYKTDSSVPKSEKYIPKKYLEQMHRYKTAMSKIYPNHKVSCFILWFEDCSVTRFENVLMN